MIFSPTRRHLLDPETLFCFARCLLLGPGGFFSGVKAWTTGPWGRPALPVSWQRATPAFSSQVINARVCFQRKGVSGTVSEWKYLHPQELWEWGKK